MKSLLADLDILMVVAGFNGVDEFDRSILGMFSLLPPGSFEGICRCRCYAESYPSLTPTSLTRCCSYWDTPSGINIIIA